MPNSVPSIQRTVKCDKESRQGVNQELRTQIGSTPENCLSFGPEGRDVYSPGGLCLLRSSVGSQSVLSAPAKIPQPRFALRGYLLLLSFAGGTAPSNSVVFSVTLGALTNCVVAPLPRAAGLSPASDPIAGLVSR